jgi:hypothetical protein
MVSGVLIAIAMVLVIPVGVMLGGAVYSAVLGWCFPASAESSETGAAE